MHRKKRDKALTGHAERRAKPRLPPEAFPSLKGAFLRGGVSVKLIDISSAGALVESEERLAPNTKICLKITATEGTFVLQGRVIRSTISQLHRGPRYSAGIAFNNKFPLQAGDANPTMVNDIEWAAEESSRPANPKLQYEPTKHPAANRTNSDIEETLTLTFSMSQISPSLRQYFESIKNNNWKFPANTVI